MMLKCAKIHNLTTIMLLALAAPLSIARGAPVASPKIAGASDLIRIELERNHQDRVFESASFGWIQNGELVSEIHAGNGNRNSIYDLASLTKPLFTTMAVTLLKEKGILKFSDPVSRYISSWEKCAIRKSTHCIWRKAIRVEDLLRHDSGLSDSAAYAGDWSVQRKIRHALDSGHEWRSVLSAVYPARPRTMEIRYQDINHITLLEVARVALRNSGSEISVEEFIRRELFQPLGMARTFPRKIPLEVLPDGVPSSVDLPVGRAHDPLARSIPETLGHAGLFSGLNDLLRFSLLLIQEGNWKGCQLLSKESIEGFGKGVRGLGWDVSSEYAGPVRGPFREGFGHTGYTGTSLWVIPRKKIAWVLLTNRTYHADGPLPAAMHESGSSQMRRPVVDTRVRIRELREFVARRIHEAQL